MRLQNTDIYIPKERQKIFIRRLRNFLEIMEMHVNEHLIYFSYFPFHPEKFGDSERLICNLGALMIQEGASFICEIKDKLKEENKNATK